MKPGLRRTSRWRNEDINPLEGAINIVDAMLVCLWTDASPGH